ncbi:MAG: adenine phosphoribosyltransferase [Chloroflexi bacterium]|nr:MAG: adenine phosphoribosyltransferase [Chloroflexota bacterium]
MEVTPWTPSVTSDDLKRYIRDVPDYPQKGIIFRDITPLLGDKKIFRDVVELMSRAWLADPPELVAGIEARGFIPGAAIAVKLGAGFVPIRKTGKLPWMTVVESYDLEYGTDQLEVHSDAVQPGQKVLIVDDVLATGGTASAAVRLMRKLGADVVGVQVLIELGYLEGRERLSEVKLVSEILY